MKTCIKNLFLLPALIAGLGLIPAGRVTAQTFTNLHNFTALSYSSPYTNTDGANPNAGVVISGNTLYGTTWRGGSSSYGAVFKVNTDGTGFTTLHNFTYTDGASPYAGLIVSGNTLYGTTYVGGSPGYGTVFAINTDGTGFTNLHHFANSDGAFPDGGLILSSNTLYGTTQYGTALGWGTVFAVNTDGTGFTNLHNFTPLSDSYPYTNSDGVAPYAGVILSGNTLYGTAKDGGSSAHGTVFAVNTDGTGFTNLHNFTATDDSGNNNDGTAPRASLLVSGNTLYGTASGGGNLGAGTVFAVHTDGTGFTTLHKFTTLANGGTNSDGAFPFGGLILSGNTLYGMADWGGSSSYGTVFTVNTDGTEFTTLYNFTYYGDGAFPYGELVLSGNNLYGTTSSGGDTGFGTVFGLSLPALPLNLNIASVGNQFVLFWPASGTNYILQSTTNLTSPNWVTASDAVPVIAFTVTNTSPARFFRLHQSP